MYINHSFSSTISSIRYLFNIKYQISNTKYQISNIEYQIPNIEYQIPNTKSTIAKAPRLYGSCQRYVFGRGGVFHWRSDSGTRSNNTTNLYPYMHFLSVPTSKVVSSQTHFLHNAVYSRILPSMDMLCHELPTSWYLNEPILQISLSQNQCATARIGISTIIPYRDT